MGAKQQQQFNALKARGMSLEEIITYWMKRYDYPETSRQELSNELEQFNDIYEEMMPESIMASKQASTNKEANYSHAYWLDPNGKIYPVRGDDEEAARRSLDRSNEDTHSAWILSHLDMLQKDYGIDPNSISGSSSDLVKLGWTRIGDAYGTDWGIDVSNFDNIPSFVDDAIAQFAPAGSMITVAGPGSARYSPSGFTFEWPVKSIQQTINSIKNRREYYQKQPVHAKQASSNVFDVNGVKVYKNPTMQQAKNLLQNSKSKEMRGFLDREANALYIWDAFELIHATVKDAVGIDRLDTDDWAEIVDDRDLNFIFNLQDKRQLEPAGRKSVFSKQAFKQWTTPEEPINNSNMDWQWADSIYQYVGDNWQDLLSGWMNLDPKNYVKPVIAIEKIYEDAGTVTAWVHIEFVNTSGNTDAFMKLIISATIQGHESIEPEGREFSSIFLTELGN